jgi:hypothetical protein
MQNKYLILFRIHNLDKISIKNFYQIYKQTLNLPDHDFLLLYDNTKKNFNINKLKAVNFLLINDQIDRTIKYELNYLLFNKRTVMFNRDNYNFWERGDIVITWAALNHMPMYEHYYLIEYDCYSDNWRQFFMDLSSDNTDMLATRIQKYEEQPSWMWFHTIHNLDFPKEKLFKSFFPVVRLSNASLDKLKDYYLLGFEGFCELITPSVVHIENLSLKNITRHITQAKILHKGEELLIDET